MKKSLCSILTCLIFSAFCGKNAVPPAPLSDAEIQKILDKVKNTPAEPVKEKETAVIETNMGTITFKFFPDVAPNTCANFKKLANAGFYDGTLFHRVIDGFMIQGGDILTRDANPANDGTGNPGYAIKGEFSDITHVPGRVSMARSQDPNSAGSQFFICHGTAPHLDGQYAVFGEVTRGLDVVNEIAKTKTDATDRPVNPVFIIKARVK